jgi:hypothetical protein
MILSRVINGTFDGTFDAIIGCMNKISLKNFNLKPKW